MKLKFLFLGAALGLVATACVQEKKFEKAAKHPATVTSVLDVLEKASHGNTPASLKKDEWVLFQYKARIFTGGYVSQGYEAFQVLSTTPDTITLSDGTVVNVNDLAIADTTYKDGDPPVVDIQKEIDCKFAPTPYNLWATDCPLPPYQDYLLYNAIQDNGEEVFFNVNTYSRTVELPPTVVANNHCYDFENCKIHLNFVEFDIYQTISGKKRRVHVTNSFNGNLPYLATNYSQCLNTIVENSDGQEVPYESCRVLVDFQYGQN